MEAMSRSQRKILLIASCVASAITPMTGSMMNLSLVGIGGEFVVGAHSLGYVNTIFLLSSVIFMVPISKFADIYGRKQLFIIGLIIHMISSFGGYFSTSYEMLLFFRFMMGTGTAAIATTAITMLTDAFPVHERGSAIGYNTASVYLGLAMGPVLGGAVNDFFSWREVFLLTVPLVLIALFAISRVDMVPRLERKRFDISGALLYTIAVTLSVLGMINIPRPEALISLVIGVGLFIAFFRYQQGIDNPILSVGIFSNKLFARSSLASFLMNSANFSVLFFISLYLQTIGALTSAQAGLILVSQPIVQTLFTPYFGKLHDRMEDKRILPTIGVAATTLGVLVMITLSLNVDLPTVVIALILFGIGNAIFNPPNTTTMMSSVEAKDRSSASATVAVVRQMGMVVSMGIAMAVISVIMGSLDMLEPSTYGNFVDVIRVSFIVSAVMCILALLASWFRGNGSVKAS